MKELEAYQRIMTCLPEGIKEAEAEAERNDRIVAGITGGEPSGMSASDKTAIFVRVTGAKTGMTYTQNLEADPEQVLLEALQNSEFVQEDKPEAMNPSYSSRQEELTHVSIDKLMEKAEKLESAGKALVPEASHIAVKVTENLRTTGIVNSHGLDRTYTKRICEAELTITCEKGIPRSVELETSAASVEELSVDYFMDKIKEWLMLPMYSCSFSSTELPAVMNGSVMCNILLTAWQMFSGDQYQKQSTPFYGQLGVKRFPDIVTLSDLPENPAVGYGRQFDCEGTSSVRVDVIKNGRIQALMHNLTTAEKTGEASTGNAGRDVNLISDQTDCRVIPTNFTLQPGQNTKKELLEQLGDGIYIDESFDMFHSVNTASGDFSIPCKGIVYRDGKPVGRVDGITMNGTVQELLENITMIANDTTTVSMIMSKSFAIAAPSILVSRLRVSGNQEGKE